MTYATVIKLAQAPAGGWLFPPPVTVVETAPANPSVTRLRNTSTTVETTVDAGTMAALTVALTAAMAGTYVSIAKFPIVDFRRYGQASVVGAEVDTAAAFVTAQTAMTAGQTLLLPFDVNHVQSDGHCDYYTSLPWELVKEINLCTDSDKVRLRILPGSTGWGTTYCSVVRNWRHSDYGGAVPTENNFQAPDTTASPTYIHKIYSLDGKGFKIHLGGYNNVTGAAFVHLHEQSRIHIVTESGAVSGAAMQWGCKPWALYANNDTVGGNGTVAGPLLVEFGVYGQGFDQPHGYLDGTNGGTSTKWIQDVTIRDSFGETLWNSLGTFKGGIKSPLYARAVNKLTLDIHVEAAPYNSPPTGVNTWTAGTVVQLGQSIVVVAASGACAGLPVMACATTVSGAGTTGGSLPSFPSPGSTVVDNNVTWTVQNFAVGNGGSTNGAVLDGALTHPGLNVTVPLGLHISPASDGSKGGWIATTAGTTHASVLPTFPALGAVARGNQITDGSVVWTYVIDTYDTASAFRLVDVSNCTVVTSRIAAFGTGTNRPLIRQTVTGTAPAQFYVFNPPTMLGVNLELGGSTMTNLSTIQKGGWWGPNVLELPNGNVPWLSASFDPRRIELMTSQQIAYLHGQSITPKTYFLVGSAPSNVQHAVTSTVTVSNTTTETVLDTFTLPASALSAGKDVEYVYAGNLDYIATSGTMTLKVYLGGTGGTQLAAISIASQGSSGTSKPWRLSGELMVRSTGASAGVVATGWNRNEAGAATSATDAVATVDLTGGLQLTCTITFGTADAGNIARLHQAIVKTP